MNNFKTINSNQNSKLIVEGWSGKITFFPTQSK